MYKTPLTRYLKKYTYQIKYNNLIKANKDFKNEFWKAINLTSRSFQFQYLESNFR